MAFAGQIRRKNILIQQEHCLVRKKFILVFYLVTKQVCHPTHVKDGGAHSCALFA